MKSSGFLWWVIVVLAAGTLAGCGGWGSVPVEGIVTLDGKPLPGATVTLQPTEGSTQNQTYTADTDSEGRYRIAKADGSADGAPPGTYFVYITSVKLPPNLDETTKLPPERVPAKWRNGSQTVEVPAGGTTEANFAMTTR